MKKFFGIGMRTFKTALCVCVCLLIYELLSLLGNMFEGGSVYSFFKTAVLDGSPSFACIAAVICMQDNIERSKKIALSRVIGSVVGGAAAVVFLSVSEKIMSGKLYIVFAAVGVILIIIVCNYLKNPISVSISVITFLIVFVGTDVGAPVYFALNRVVGTLIGAFTALFINRFISPPEKE